MSRDMLPNNPRLLELLAERALGTITDAESQELSTLLAAAGVSGDQSFDLVAGMASEAMVRADGISPMPDALRRKLEACAGEFLAGRDVIAKPDFRAPTPSPRSRSAMSFAPWFVAAASVALAVVAWKPWTPGPVRYDPVQNRQAFLAMKGSVKAGWSDFVAEGKSPPEIAGVQGDVVWNETAQDGYMRFVGLPRNNPDKEQYQLWIIDKRGFSQRVSGGVFDACDGSGECVVRISPSLPIHGAAAFAVTIEPPGGNAVSDVTRRVCIASVK